MAPPNPKVRKAFAAMKDLGISEAKVKPVLKKLLKLYDKNWELIEADNYRALADAIFDEEEAVTPQKKKAKNVEAAPDSEEEALANEESERPLKRLRRRGEGVSSSPSGNSSPSLSLTPSRKPKNENDETLPSKSLQQLRLTMVPITTGMIIPKDEPFTDEMPLQVIHPVPLNTANSVVSNLPLEGRTSEEPLKSLNAEGHKVGQMKPSTNEKVNDCELSMIPMGSPGVESENTSHDELVTAPMESKSESTSMVIASSPMGEVKISLSCSSGIAGSNFRMPSLDKLQESMEEKCLRSYKILDPNFSIMNLMKDMCQCFIELAANSSQQSQEKITYVTPSLDLLKRSSARDVLAFGDDVERTLNRKEVLSSAEKDNNNGEDLNSRSLVVLPQSQLTPDEMRSLSCFHDITRGEESIEIPWLNEISDEFPPSFYYIPRSLIFQSASVKFALSNIRDESCCSSCFGDCLVSEVPCACGCQTGGFVYTSAGLLKEDFLEECISLTRDPQKQCLQSCTECPLEKAKNEDLLEPCKGHLKRKIIKECWCRCGCSKQCGNRVVQRGINHKLQVFLTPEGKGWGLRNLEKLPKGAFVCEYAGEILTITELCKRASEKRTCPVILDAHWGSGEVAKEEKALSFDAMYFGNIARFINHRCLDANLIEVPVEMETSEHHYYHLAFFTTREINAMEELTWDYGIDFDDHDHPVKVFQCLCGSKFCRHMKRTNKSKHVQNGR